MRTSSDMNLCLRTFFDTNLFLHELPHANFLHTEFFRYENFTYESYPIRTFSITNESRCEPYTIGMNLITYTNLCLRALAYEPFPIQTLCLRTSVLEARVSGWIRDFNINPLGVARKDWGQKSVVPPVGRSRSAASVDIAYEVGRGGELGVFEGARAPPERGSAPSHCQKHPLKMKENFMKHRFEPISI